MGEVILDPLNLAELDSSTSLFGWSANAEEWAYIEAFLLRAKAGASAFQNYYRMVGFVVPSKDASLKAAMKESKLEIKKRARTPASTSAPFIRIDGVLAFIISASSDIRSCMTEIDELRKAEYSRPLSRTEYILLDEARQLMLRQTVTIEIIGEALCQVVDPSYAQRQYNELVQRGTSSSSSSETCPSRPPAASIVDTFVLFELTSRLYKTRDPATDSLTEPAPEQRIDATEAVTPEVVESGRAPGEDPSDCGFGSQYYFSTHRGAGARERCELLG